MCTRDFTMAVAALNLLILAACGGGGGGTPVGGGPDPVEPPVLPEGISVPLPSDHGLAAGVISVAPGASAEHGNVVVSCPAGDSACVVTVAADGTATYDRTGGMPSVMAAHSESLALVAREHSRANSSAEDLLDHWDDPQTLRTALELSAVSQSHITERENHLKALLGDAGGNSENTGAGFRNVRLEDIEIIGERNGITYGQWKGGPAGTLNIEFDWRFAPDINPAAHAWMERAGKIWSWHLKDDFDKHVARQGTEIRYGVNPDGSKVVAITLVEDIPIDDLLFVMQQYHGLDGGGANPHRFSNCWAHIGNRAAYQSSGPHLRGSRSCEGERRRARSVSVARR